MISQLIFDRIGLILVGIVFAAFAAWMMNVIGQDFLFVIFGLSYIGQMMENARLHKKLKELGHPQDLRSRIEAKKTKAEISSDKE